MSRDELERTVRRKTSEAEQSREALREVKLQAERMERDVTADVELLAEEHRRATMREKDLERTVQHQRSRIDELAESNALLERRTALLGRSHAARAPGRGLGGGPGDHGGGGGGEVHPTAAAIASQSARQPQPQQYGRMSLGDLGREQQQQQKQQQQQQPYAAARAPHGASYDDQLLSWERERSTR